MKEEEQLLIVLDLTIQFQMVVETLDKFEGTRYNKFFLKKRMKECKEMLEDIVKRDYNIVYRNGAEETINIINQYEELISLIRTLNVPEKVILNQLIQAWGKDPKSLEGIVNKINKQ